LLAASSWEVRQGMPTRGREAVLTWVSAGDMEHQIVASGGEGGNRVH
jgi:hypothetical protein